MSDSNAVRNRKLAVIDDDQASRTSLTAMLKQAGCEVVSYQNLEDFYQSLPNLSGMTCLLLEQSVGDTDAVSALLHLRKLGYPWPAIIVSADVSVRFAMDALSQGIEHVLIKPVDQAELLTAIDRCHDKYRQDVEQQERTIRRKRMLESLSPREREVLRHVACGRLNKQIANEMSISVRTVESFRGRIMSKIEAESIADLVAFALAADLISNRY